MARRTIYLPDELDQKIEKLARRQRRSFSSVLADFAETALRRRTKRHLTSSGSGVGPGDLGERAEEYLAELFAEFDD